MSERARRSAAAFLSLPRRAALFFLSLHSLPSGAGTGRDAGAGCGRTWATSPSGAGRGAWEGVAHQLLRDGKRRKRVRGTGGDGRSTRRSESTGHVSGHAMGRVWAGEAQRAGPRRRLLAHAGNRAAAALSLSLLRPPPRPTVHCFFPTLTERLGPLLKQRVGLLGRAGGRLRWERGESVREQ